MKKLLFIMMLYSFPIHEALSQITYYIDYTNGNDTLMGTSPVTAWKTLSKVNAAPLLPGDSVLFKRNEIWRGQLIPVSGNASGRIYYGAYGTGNLPLIKGSENMNRLTDWEEETSHIWVCTTTFSTDIGNIILDNEDHAGIKKWSAGDLLVQDDFYYNLNNGELRMYSVGNPAEVHSTIECALRNHIVDQTNKSFITYEHLALKYGGAHGFGGGNTSNITIRNCEISWIGGSDLLMDGQIRFGNAIEFWSKASDHLVENNKIWDIYDTGLTNQSTSYAVQKNIIYRNNLIWNCGMAALEIWNRPASSVTKNICFENNTCVNMGYGWGIQRPDYRGYGYAAWSNTSQTDSVFIRNNIFVNPLRAFYVFDNLATFLDMDIDYNCYYTEELTDTMIHHLGGSETIIMQHFDTYRDLTGDDENSILEDPLFEDEAQHNFHLSDESPCINAGIKVNNPYDIEGIPRPKHAGYDIGAYEYFDPNTNVPEIYKGNINIYPNPSHGVIHITIPGASEVPGEICIYDLSGHLIRRIKTDHDVTTDICLNPGLYLLSVTTKAIQTIRYIVIV